MESKLGEAFDGDIILINELEQPIYMAECIGFKEEPIDTVHVDFDFLNIKHETSIDHTNILNIVADNNIKIVPENDHDTQKLPIGNNNELQLGRSRSEPRTIHIFDDHPPQRRHSTSLEAYKFGSGRLTPDAQTASNRKRRASYKRVDRYCKKNKISKVGAMFSTGGRRANYVRFRIKGVIFEVPFWHRLKRKSNTFMFPKKYESVQRKLLNVNLRRQRICNTRTRANLKKRVKEKNILCSNNNSNGSYDSYNIDISDKNLYSKMETEIKDKNSEDGITSNTKGGNCFNPNLNNVGKQYEAIQNECILEKVNPLIMETVEFAQARHTETQNRMVAEKATVLPQTHVAQGVTFKLAENMRNPVNEDLRKNVDHSKITSQSTHTIIKYNALSGCNIGLNVVEASPSSNLVLPTNQRTQMPTDLSQCIINHPTLTLKIATYLECAQELSVYLVFHIKTFYLVDYHRNYFIKLGVNLSTVQKVLRPLLEAPENVFEFLYKRFVNFFVVRWIPRFQFKELYEQMVDFIHKNFPPKLPPIYIFHCLLCIGREMYKRAPGKFTYTFVMDAEALNVKMIVEEQRFLAQGYSGPNKEVSPATQCAATTQLSSSAANISKASKQTGVPKRKPRNQTGKKSHMSKNQRALFFAQCNIYRTINTTLLTELSFIYQQNQLRYNQELQFTINNQRMPTSSNSVTQAIFADRLFAPNVPMPSGNDSTQLGKVTVPNNHFPSTTARIIPDQKAGMARDKSVSKSPLADPDTTVEEIIDLDKWLSERLIVDKAINTEYHVETTNVGECENQTSVRAVHPEIMLNRICICSEKATLVCQCQKSIYCSQKCQRDDWEKHQNICNNCNEKEEEISQPDVVEVILLDSD